MTTDTVIREIPLEQLHDSPFNPRRVYGALEDLASSIRAEGRIHEPLLVRPRLTNPLRDDVQDGWEIVFGHRRRRAAELAGLPTAPCMVRAMTDAEARRAQAAENLQRENIHAFEEAEGYQAMLERDGLSADQVAERVGKSRSHVYGRLKLLQACEQVRSACLEGRIGAEVALLLARLRTTRLQEKALARIDSRIGKMHLEDGGKGSFRRIRDLLAEDFTLRLKDAIFDREDATLLPDAGICSACPKRAGNAPEFEDLARHEDQRHQWRPKGGPDVCTDPDCWAAKKEAHLARAAAAHAARGVAVVTGNKARAALAADGKTVKGAYVAASEVKAALKKVAGAAPKQVLIQDQRTGKTVAAYKRDDLVAAGLKGVTAAPAKGADAHEAKRKQHEAERKAQAAALEAENAARVAMLVRVRQEAALRPRTALELRLITAAAIQGVNWDDKELLIKLHGCHNQTQLLNRLNDMDADELGRVLLDVALVKDVRIRYYTSKPAKPGNLLSVAQQMGLDLKAARAEATGSAVDQQTLDLLNTDDVDIHGGEDEDQDEEARAEA
ncbi:MAG: ParB/RepB/Spo0J family partition protein [Rubrivivax sp.]|nr:ParB/RepB/Spo0J family partition protein [Rubrivivax sp.]